MNVIDAAALVLALAGLVVVAAGIQLARKPSSPQVDSVDPQVLVASRDMRVRLTGRHLNPFHRVLVERADAPALAFRLEREERSDEFTLSNRARVRLVVESDRTAEAWLPDGLLPGTYNLLFFDDTTHLTTVARAFEIRPTATASIRVSGAFRRLDPSSAGRMRAGSRVSAGESAVEILALGEQRAETSRLDVGASTVEVPDRNSVQLPAVLRFTCQVIEEACWVAGQRVASMGDLHLEGGALTFTVKEVRPEGPAEPERGTVRVRVVAPQQIAGQVKAGDRHQPDGIASMEADSARILAVQAVKSSSSDVTLDVTFEVPVQAVDGAAWYQGIRVRAGEPFVFQTDRYVLRGTVIDAVIQAEGESRP